MITARDFFILSTLTLISSSFSWGLDSNTFQRIPVHFECSLHPTSVPTCNEIAQDFEDKYKSHFLIVPQYDREAIQVTVPEAITLEDKTEYSFTFEGDPEYFNIERIMLKVDVLTAADLRSKLDQLSEALFKCATPFLTIRTIEKGGNTIEVSYESVEAAPEEPDEDTVSPWYGEVNGGLSSTKTLVNNNTNMSLSTYGNYSGKSLRVQLTTGADYQSIALQQSTGKIAADNWHHMEKLVVSNTFSNRWTVALIAQNRQDPGANIKGSTQIGGAVEWNLVPYKIKDSKQGSKQFMFRTGLSHADLKLAFPNIADQTETQYPLGFLQFSAHWLLAHDKLSINSKSYTSMNMKQTKFKFLQLSADITYQFSKRLGFSYGISASHQKYSQSYPGNIGMLKPGDTFFLKDVPGGVNVTQTGKIVVKVGKEDLKVKDKRLSD